MGKTARRCLAGAVLALLAITASAALDLTLTRGPYLQAVDSTSALIVWRTSLPGNSRVEYGVGAYTHRLDLPGPTSEHVVTLTNLITGTEVIYRIATDDIDLANGSFHTAAAPGQPFDFAVVGDSGWWRDTTALYQVADRMTELNPQFVLHTGDVIYPDGQADGYDPYFFLPYQALLRHAPFFPTLGNHDYHTQHAQPYLDAFYLPHNNPANTERYYSFDWGDAHFTALDFNTGPKPEQLEWLKNDLASTDRTWKIVFYHQAIYSSGPHGYNNWVDAKRQLLAPIFEQNHVDVVFNGHDHDYERTQPINGVVYVVSGGGGGTLYEVKPQPFSAYAESTYHTVFVSLDHCALTLQAIKPDGAIFDSTTLTKDCPAPEPTLVPALASAPVSPIGFVISGPVFLPVIWKRN